MAEAMRDARNRRTEGVSGGTHAKEVVCIGVFADDGCRALRVDSSRNGSFRGKSGAIAVILRSAELADRGDLHPQKAGADW